MRRHLFPLPSSAPPLSLSFSVERSVHGDLVSFPGIHCGPKFSTTGCLRCPLSASYSQGVKWYIMGKGGKKNTRPRLLELTEYEMEKYRNIQQKNEILSAHGFKPITTSFMGSNGKRERIMVDVDDPDYRPSFDDDVEDEGDGEANEHQILMSRLVHLTINNYIT